MYNSIEAWPREKLQELQDEQLRRMVHYVYEHVPFYRTMFHTKGIEPGDIHSVEDLRNDTVHEKARFERPLSLWPAGSTTRTIDTGSCQ